MFADIVLPNLGFDMLEGRLVRWLKQPGDLVHKGEAIAEVEGDKATVELEALADGVFEQALVAVDAVVPVGTVLGRIRTGAAAAQPAAPLQAVPEPRSAEPTSPPAKAKSGRISPVAQRMAQEHGIDPQALGGTGAGGRVTRGDVEAAVSTPLPVQPAPTPMPPPAQNGGRALAAPAVRKLARDYGIDLKTVQGTGKDGHITRADVEAVLKPPAPPVVPVEVVEGRREVTLSVMRQTIARRLTQSVQEAPHFYTTAELDFTDALAKLPKGVGVNALILYLTVKALQAQPELNATYENGRLYQYDHVHLGIAIALPNGLVSPVLASADDYSLSGLAQRSRDLIERTRAGKLRANEVSGGTFTVSNLGMVGQVERFTAIINPPQVAILAVGAVKPRPVVVDGGLYLRTTAYLTLSADHRVVDGMLAARFLEAFDQELQAV